MLLSFPWSVQVLEIFLLRRPVLSLFRDRVLSPAVEDLSTVVGIVVTAPILVGVVVAVVVAALLLALQSCLFMCCGRSRISTEEPK